ncbi:MAG: FecR domain-containing protein [Oligoflexales bacterium]|nr:FecR domain-containing protein [Oligoflexales bacterium]
MPDLSMAYFTPAINSRSIIRFLFLLLAYSAALFAEEDNQIARVTRLYGKARILVNPRDNIGNEGTFILHNGKFYQIRELALATPILKGSIIITGKETMLRLAYNNGDQITVSSSAIYEINWKTAENEGKPVIDLSFGTLRAVIQKSGPRNGTVINAGEIEVVVKGTDFHMISDSNTGFSKVTAVRGKVYLRQKSKTNAKEIEIPEGYSAEMPASQTKNDADSMPEESGKISTHKTTRSELDYVRSTSLVEMATIFNPQLSELIANLEKKSVKAALEDIKEHHRDQYENILKEKKEIADVNYLLDFPIKKKSNKVREKEDMTARKETFSDETDTSGQDTGKKMKDGSRKEVIPPKKEEPSIDKSIRFQTAEKIKSRDRKIRIVDYSDYMLPRYNKAAVFSLRYFEPNVFIQLTPSVKSGKHQEKDNGLSTKNDGSTIDFFGSALYILPRAIRAGATIDLIKTGEKYETASGSAKLQYNRQETDLYAASIISQNFGLGFDVLFLNASQELNGTYQQTNEAMAQIISPSIMYGNSGMELVLQWRQNIERDMVRFDGYTRLDALVPADNGIFMTGAVIHNLRAYTSSLKNTTDLTCGMLYSTQKWYAGGSLTYFQDGKDGYSLGGYGINFDGSSSIGNHQEAGAGIGYENHRGSVDQEKSEYGIISIKLSYFKRF